MKYSSERFMCDIVRRTGGPAYSPEWFPTCDKVIQCFVLSIGAMTTIVSPNVMCFVGAVQYLCCTLALACECIRKNISDPLHFPQPFPYYLYKMSQMHMNVMVEKLYEEAFNIKYDWKKMLSKEVFEYHDLVCCECNVPVDLQMGTILPFMASCLGPGMKGLF